MTKKKKFYNIGARVEPEVDPGSVEAKPEVEPEVSDQLEDDQSVGNEAEEEANYEDYPGVRFKTLLFLCYSCSRRISLQC